MPVPDAVLLRVEEAGDRLGLSKGSVQRLIREGKIRAVKIGKSTRVPVSEINRYVDDLLAAQG